MGIKGAPTDFKIIKTIAFETTPKLPKNPKAVWIFHSDWMLDGRSPYQCSECGRAYDTPMKYCGSCGVYIGGEVVKLDQDKSK